MQPETTILQPAPAGLGEAGASFWAAICSGWALRADEAAVLDMACRTLDDIAKIEAKLDGADLIMSGSVKQPIAHPLLVELRGMRALLAAQIRQLGLADDVVGPVKSARHVKAANARWSRAG